METGRKPINLVGQHFGEWEVLSYDKNRRWFCKCSCGKVKSVDGAPLRKGQSTNCGCKNAYKTDMAGKRFGEWTVISYAGNSKWNCVCSCGKRKAVLGKILRNGQSKSCGCKNIVDLTGKKFGYLTVLGRGKQKGKWLVKCECGNEKEVFYSCLMQGNTKSCGCKSWNDLTGKRFGRLVVIEKAESYLSPNGNSYIQWRCRCDCGNEVVVRSGALTIGHTQSCGCYGREAARAATTKHLQSNSRLYWVWHGMKQRCENPNATYYKIYGGRGIKVCKEWSEDFVPFYEWAMANGYDPDAPKGECTIDRIDVNGNYCPENCRWATITEQSNNKRQNVYVEIGGERKTLKTWCDIYKINYGCVAHRIKIMGWDAERAITTPSSRRKKIV